ncbi:MAG TPA: nucleotidyltransferase family protein [Burkholderiales bacterium]|nr:nucleotidyltransferase family protein [Burkholderiales bacterium]
MLSGVFLAAGRSSRFGADKLLHPLADGTPMAVAALRSLRAAVPAVVAVLRRDDDALARLLEYEGARVSACPRAGEGMGASLAWGVAQAAGADGWLVALADMPFIRPPTVAGVARALERGAPIAAPVHAGRRGHPVGFAAALREELLALGGDQGARALLIRHAAAVVAVECDDPGVLLDIDEPADLAAR